MTLHALYRFYDADDRLLYIGITNNPARRFSKHRDERHWWSTVARITLEQFTSRDDLRAAERAAIQTEAPVHNVRMNGESKSRNPLVWTCHACGKPVDDGKGYIELTIAEMLEFRRREDELDRKYPKVGGNGQPIFQAIPLSEVGPPARWHVFHTKCDPEPQTESWYWLAVERIRTVEQLCCWTLHLSEKGWYQDTNWSHVAYGRLNEIGLHCFSVMA